MTRFSFTPHGSVLHIRGLHITNDSKYSLCGRKLRNGDLIEPWATSVRAGDTTGWHMCEVCQKLKVVIKVSEEAKS